MVPLNVQLSFVLAERPSVGFGFLFQLAILCALVAVVPPRSDVPDSIFRAEPVIVPPGTFSQVDSTPLLHWRQTSSPMTGLPSPTETPTWTVVTRYPAEAPFDEVLLVKERDRFDDVQFSLVLRIGAAQWQRPLPAGVIHTTAPVFAKLGAGEMVAVTSTSFTSAVESDVLGTDVTICAVGPSGRQPACYCLNQMRLSRYGIMDRRLEVSSSGVITQATWSKGINGTGAEREQWQLDLPR